MPDTYNWLLDIPFWDESPIGGESKQFSLEDFLMRSKRPGDRSWCAHFRNWCRVRRSDTLELYDVRSIGSVHGVEMLLVTRFRASHTRHPGRSIN